MSKHSDPVENGADQLKGSRFCLRLPLTFAQSASRKIHALPSEQTQASFSCHSTNQPLELALLIQI